MTSLLVFLQKLLPAYRFQSAAAAVIDHHLKWCKQHIGEKFAQGEELLLALNSDVESDATGAFIRDRVGNPGLRISRLAHGLPVGSGVSYLDSITLGRAIEGRQVI